MLKSLSVKNYALIKNLNLQFDSNLNIITGETGAGKSILLGAIGLILGDRFDSKLSDLNGAKLVVEAHFQINNYQLKDFFSQHELDYDDDAILRREITDSGKSRAFINDTPVNLSLLKELGEQLVSIHSQHENLSLNDKNFQINLIDHFANSLSLRDAFKQEFKSWKNLKKEIQELKSQEENNKNDQDYYQFLLQELEEASINPNETEELEKEQQILSNSDEIRMAAEQASSLLKDDSSSILEQLGFLHNLLKNADKSGEFFRELSSRLLSNIIDLEDLAREIESKTTNLVFDPQRLQLIEERLELIYRLQKKHRLSHPDELLEILNDIRNKVDSIASVSESIEAKEKELAILEKELLKKGEALSASRKGIIKKLEEQIKSMLNEVGMPNSAIKIEINNLNLDNANVSGMDEISILFCSNPGNPFLPVYKIASGGELSRLMLVLKSLMAEKTNLGTLIFDEIDTGISGEIAARVAKLMKKLGEKHQVFSITHLPQIAGIGHSHYFVFKITDGKTTETGVKKLNKEERITEIAKMISGETPTEAALKNARELVLN